MLAILPQAALSPLTLQTLTLLQPQHSDRGRTSDGDDTLRFFRALRRQQDIILRFLFIVLLNVRYTKLLPLSTSFTRFFY
jgi:hypothetical protein